MPRLDVDAPPEELFPGCWRITLPDPFVPGVTSAFLLRGEDGDWLLDSGADTPECLEALEAKLGSLGMSLAELRGVILSHSHLDHAGGLLRWTPARLLAHAAAADEMSNLDPRSSRGPQALRLMGVPADEIGDLAPYGEPVAGTPLAGISVTTRLEGGQGTLPELEGWEWRLAEGHAPGHLMLHHRAESAFLVGDQFLDRWKTPLRVSDPDFDSVGAYAESARDTLREDPAVLYSSHTTELRPAAEWLQERLAQLDRQAERTLQAVRGGARSAYDALFKAYSRVPEGGLRVLFLREQLAMLRHLAARGEISRGLADGAEVFSG
ncbi:MAG: MBL fold metallo-hydrolase [Gemmatimonadota bacterium]